jgi:hypothetical protein
LDAGKIDSFTKRNIIAIKPKKIVFICMNESPQSSQSESAAYTVILQKNVPPVFAFFDDFKAVVGHFQGHELMYTVIVVILFCCILHY